MVKIRYAGIQGGVSARFVIEHAISNTSLQFGNNIVANRFEQVDSHYEVTIKCVSSRGKGAKHGPSGRPTTSCCWHAWGTFFDELFRLNPDIVIIAQGNRITRESGNWIDHSIGNNLHEHDMCYCEENGWVRTPLPPPLVEEETIPEEEPITIELPARVCDTCRYSSTNTPNFRSQCPPGRCLSIEGLQHWEQCVPPVARRCDASCAHHSTNTGVPCPPEIICGVEFREGWAAYDSSVPPTTVHRHCTTCRFSSYHNNGVICSTCNTCNERNHFPLWEVFVEPVSTTDPTPMSERHCYDCKYNHSHAGTRCPYTTECLIGNDHRLFERWVEPVVEPVAPAIERHCSNCKYSHYNTPLGAPMCDDVIGRCSNMDKWELYVVPQLKDCTTCRYSRINGATVGCYDVVGLCARGNKWAPVIDLEGFNPELYMSQPTVMPEEKGYMDFDGVV